MCSGQGRGRLPQDVTFPPPSPRATVVACTPPFSCTTMLTRLTSWWHRLRDSLRWDFSVQLDPSDIVPGTPPPGDTPLDQAAHALSRAQRLFVLAGSGLSAESGIATFRVDPDALYQQPLWRTFTHRATYDRDPIPMLTWHQRWRDELRSTTPNPAHHALASLARRIPHVFVATLNVDALLEDAVGPAPPASLDIVHLHGEILWVRCDSCQDRFEDHAFDFLADSACPICQGARRPDVVWFGEALPEERLERASQAAARADVCLIIGTSGIVHPAAQLAQVAARAGAVLLEINPNPSELSALASVTLRAPAGEILPDLLLPLAALASPQHST